MNALAWGVPVEVNVDPMLETYRLSGDERMLKQVLEFARRPSLQGTASTTGGKLTT